MKKTEDLKPDQLVNHSILPEGDEFCKGEEGENPQKDTPTEEREEGAGPGTKYKPCSLASLPLNEVVENIQRAATKQKKGFVTGYQPYKEFKVKIWNACMDLGFSHLLNPGCMAKFFWLYSKMAVFGWRDNNRDGYFRIGWQMLRAALGRKYSDYLKVLEYVGVLKRFRYSKFKRLSTQWHIAEPRHSVTIKDIWYSNQLFADEAKKAGPLNEGNAWVWDTWTNHTSLSVDFAGLLGWAKESQPNSMLFNSLCRFACKCFGYIPHFPKIGKNGNRYHDPVTVVKSEARQFLLIDGEPVACLDIPSCFMTICRALFAKEVGQGGDTQGKKRDLEQLDWFIANDIYTHQMAYTKATSRAEQKGNNMQTLFAENVNAKHPATLIWFSANLPHFTKWLNGDSVNAVKLQQLESSIMSEEFIPLLKSFLIRALRAHDAVYVPQSKAKQAQSLFNRVLGRYMPDIKVDIELYQCSTEQLKVENKEVEVNHYPMNLTVDELNSDIVAFGNLKKLIDGLISFLPEEEARTYRFNEFWSLTGEKAVEEGFPKPNHIKGTLDLASDVYCSDECAFDGSVFKTKKTKKQYKIQAGRKPKE